MKEVIVPDVGDSQEVTVIEILVNAGDSVEQEQSVVTLETDKATVEIPATDAGTVGELKVAIGDKVKEGDVLLLLKLSSNEPTSEVKSIETEIVEPSNPVQEEPNEATTEGDSFIDIVIPDIGTDQEVEVIEIHVSPGDSVKEEQSIFTIESEKASVDIPAPTSGVIDSLNLSVSSKVKQGDTVGVLKSTASTILSSPVKKNESKSEEKPVKKESKPEPVKPLSSTAGSDVEKSNSDCVYAGPGIRRLARDLGVNLSKVQGSGRKNRILKEDLFAFVKKELNSPKTTQSSASNDLLGKSPDIDFSKYGDITELQLSRIKMISGKFLHRNWLNIPHVTHFEDADITDLEDFRKMQKDAALKQGIRLTPLVFLMRAVVAALKKYPNFNSSISPDGDKIFLKHYYHIGIAVDTPNGLVVPVIRDVDKKGLFDLAAELGEISLKAREGKLKPQDMQGGCFSISSLGGIGGHAFTPIINAPEVAILGVSRSSHKPIYINGEFVPRLMLPLSLSYDHRVIDGAEAARFSKYLVDKLSDIRRLLL